MNKKGFYLGIFIAVSLLISGPGKSDAATYSGAWIPTHLTLFAIDTTFGASGNEFGIWDIEGDGDLMALFSITSFNSIIFSAAGSGVNATLDDGTPGLVTLPGNSHFGLYFRDTSTSQTFTSYDVVESGNNFIISSTDTNMQVIAHDLSPVPVPGAMVLLGSGLAGLIAINNRKNRLTA